jgi:guanylate kinase
VARPRPLLAVLTGPSAAGKDSVRARFKSWPDSYSVIATTTTRLPREGEVNGDDLNFVSEAEFRRMLENGELLEHATVYKHFYGVPKAEVRRALAAGKDVILRTDVQGARYIKSVVPAALTVFVAPPSMEELERRLRSRGSDSPEQMALRLRTAASEMECAGEFDYTVVNDDLDRCVAEVREILERERARPERPPAVVE